MRTSRLPLAAALAAAALLVLPAAGQAQLPAFSGRSFAANVGVGGAKLGQRVATGLRAWGGARRASCNNLDCVYNDPRRPQLGTAVLDYEDGRGGKVTKLVLTAGVTTSGRYVYKTPLASILGPRGIHLGSSERAVRKAYPTAKPAPGETFYVGLRDRHGNQTYFSFNDGHLFQIIVEDKRPRG